MAKKKEEVDPAISELTNEQLRSQLTELGIVIGPIVDSTRKIYEKKLVTLKKKADASAFSTDEEADEPVGAIAETESIPKSTETPKKRGRPVKSKSAPVEDKFSDDEDIPVGRNTSSQRRRSARIQKKVVEVVEVVEPIAEEPETQENGEAAIVVQTEIPETPEKIEEETVSSEVDAAIDESAEVEPVIESEPEPAKAKLDLPWHTIGMVLLISIFVYLVWQQRDTHLAYLEALKDWLVAKYVSAYESLMPQVEEIQLEPAAPPSAEAPTPEVATDA